MRLNVRHFQVLNLFLCFSLVPFFFHASYLMMSLFLYVLFLGLGINIGLHRGFSHSTLQTNSVLGKLCLFFSVLCCMGKPTDWILVHRLHHQYSDTAIDPHSPKDQGFLSIFLNIWSLPKAIPIRQLVSLRKKLREDTVLVFFDRFYWFLIAAYICALLGLGGPLFVVYFWSLPSLLALLATSLVNSVCHNLKGEIVDHPLVSLFTLGEGYHRSHHISPKKIYFSEWKAFDLSGFVFKLLSR